MGNVFASSLTQPPMPDVIPPPYISEQPGAPKDTSNSDKNPGYFEDLHKKCKNVFPQVFEGSRLLVNTNISHHFQTSHSLKMSSFSPAVYRWGATYAGTKIISPMEAYPVLSGDVDPSGNMNAGIIHQLNGNIRTKFGAEVQDGRFVATQLSADYKGSDFTASATLGIADILNGSGVAVLQYLQNVVPSLALGAEMHYQYGPQVPGGEMPLVSFAGRYTGSNCTISGTVGPASLHACFYRKENDYIQVGVEAKTNLISGESVCSLGYQLDLPKRNLVFRGMLDSNWTVGAVLEKRLAPLPYILSLSGMINHTTSQCLFGIGLMC